MDSDPPPPDATEDAHADADGQQRTTQPNAGAMEVVDPGYQLVGNLLCDLRLRRSLSRTVAGERSMVDGERLRLVEAGAARLSDEELVALLTAYRANPAERGRVLVAHGLTMDDVAGPVPGPGRGTWIGDQLAAKRLTVVATTEAPALLMPDEPAADPDVDTGRPVDRRTWARLLRHKLTPTNAAASEVYVTAAALSQPFHGWLGKPPDGWPVRTRAAYAEHLDRVATLVRAGTVRLLPSRAAGAMPETRYVLDFEPPYRATAYLERGQALRHISDPDSVDAVRRQIRSVTDAAAPTGAALVVLDRERTRLSV